VSLIDRYGALFRTRAHDNAGVAQRYLQGLAQAATATCMEMASVVEGGCEQQFQHFISNSPWWHEPVIEQIGRDADRRLGGKPNSALIIDESRFPKQGDRSVGVARQWCGRLGKIDNCQVAVFTVLTDSGRHTPVDMRLYLPQRWIEDAKRCDLAEVPLPARRLRAKSQLAPDMVHAARTRGMRFGWIGTDGGDGKEPPSCARWMTRTRCLSPMFMARSGSGVNRRGCTCRRQRPAEGDRQAASAPLQQTAGKLGHPFPYDGAEVFIAWFLFDRLA
jgi:SRSO17 transposase